MPDDVAIEKVQVLEKLGAKVERVRPGMHSLWSISDFAKSDGANLVASYVDEKQFVVRVQN